MNLAQSPHTPAEGTKPGFSDLRWLVPYAARGFCELVRARMIFTKLEAKAIPQRNRAAKQGANTAATIDAPVLARMAYVLPRISDRLPWRSDCLIQAIAAQNWLSALGAASEIQIGVEHPKGGNFGAHAWLLYKDAVVTGGDIERYQLLLSDSQMQHDSRDDRPAKGDE